MINLSLVGKTTYMLVVPGDLSSRSLRPTHHRTSPIILIPLVFSRLLSQSLTSSSFLFFLNIKFHLTIQFLFLFTFVTLYSTLYLQIVRSLINCCDAWFVLWFLCWLLLSFLMTRFSEWDVMSEMSRSDVLNCSDQRVLRFLRRKESLKLMIISKLT